MVQAVQFLSAFLMHLLKMRLRALGLCLEPEAHRRWYWSPGFMGAAGLRTPNSGLSSLLQTAPALSSCQHLSITGWLRLEWNSGGHLLQIPSSSRVAQSQLPRTVSRQFFNISKNEESTTSLGNLCSAWSLSQQKNVS